MRKPTWSGWLVVILVGSLMGSGCFGGGGPKEKKISLTLVGAENLNNCGEELANPLVIRVYKLSAESKINSLGLVQLWGNEKDVLKGELLSQEEIVLNPGQTREVDVLADLDTSFLGIAGNFCETQGDCWRWVSAVDAMKGKVKITFKETCLEVTAKH